MNRKKWGKSASVYGNKCMPQILIRYERVNEGWDKVIDKFSLAPPDTKIHLGRANVNPNHVAGYRKYYNDKTIKKMEARWGNDLLSLGYTIDGPIDDSIFINPEQSHRRIQ